MEKQAHVERLPDGSKLLHEDVIEARKVAVLKRSNNGTRERHRASLDGIMLVLCVLGVNVFGDGVRDALDPRSKSRIGP